MIYYVSHSPYKNINNRKVGKIIYCPPYPFSVFHKGHIQFKMQELEKTVPVIKNIHELDFNPVRGFLLKSLSYSLGAVHMAMT